MTKKSIIYPFLALMTIGAVSAEESKALTNQSIIIDENLNEWVLVKEENGIKVYFSLYEAVDGSLSIKIRFKNISSVNKKLNWEIINLTTESKIYQSEELLNVDANSELVFIKEGTPLSLEIGNNMSDYTINIK